MIDPAHLPELKRKFQEFIPVTVQQETGTVRIEVPGGRRFVYVDAQTARLFAGLLNEAAGEIEAMNLNRRAEDMPPEDRPTF